MEAHCIAFAKAVSKQSTSVRIPSKATVGADGSAAAFSSDGEPAVDPMLVSTLTTLLGWCEQCTHGGISPRVLLESARALWSLSLRPAVLDLM
jgi:hypothetical protein